MRRFRKKTSTPEERAAWITRFRASGLSQRRFALKHGLNVTTLQSWLYGKRGQGGTESAVKFQELKLANHCLSESPWAVEIQAEGGTQVRVRAQVDPRWVAQLLQPLSQSC
ncbi:MAG: hypothetical protein L0Z50_32625 [Verrucomicrobiales bacterium]|nr:hypothetical protein [Verrucomicrobiales bacterium]